MMSQESKLKIEELDTRIIKYRLYDKKNGAVLYYTIDLDKYQLSIQGETCGSYKWTETPSESFLELMVRCNQGYLLNKLFCQKFSCSQSIKSVKNYIKDICSLYIDKNERECLREISEIEANSSDYFISQVFDILEEYNIDCDDYDVWSCVEKDYDYWDKKAISYFCNNIKPKLRKKLEKLQNG